MQLTDGERGRLDRSRRRPADGPAPLALKRQRVNGIYSTICSARRRTERPGRSRSPFPTASLKLEQTPMNARLTMKITTLLVTLVATIVVAQDAKKSDTAAGTENKPKEAPAPVN